MKNSYRAALKHGILLVLALALAIPVSSETTNDYTYDGTDDPFVWNKPSKGVVNGTVDVVVEGSGGGGSGQQSGGDGGKATGYVNVSNRPSLDIYAAEGGGPSAAGAGGYGHVNGTQGDGDGGGGAGMAAVVDPDTGKEIIGAGGGSGGVTDQLFQTDTGGPGANTTNGGTSPGTDTDANGNPGAGFVSGEVIGGSTYIGGGGSGGSASSQGSPGNISLTYDINNYSVINSNLTYNGTNYGDLKQSSQFVNSDRLTLRSNVTDPDDNIKEVSLVIRDSENNLRLNNGSMTGIRPVSIDGHPGSTFERNHSFSQDIPLGEWSYTVWVKDNRSLYTKSGGNLEVVDETAPEWRNLQQNQSKITIDESVELSAEGLDNYNLSSAVLATNETGSWENKTDVYGSPQSRIFTEDTYTKTSFNWKNSSMTGNNTVYWKIWYNDTSSQYTSTDAKSFIVRENVNYDAVTAETLTYSRQNDRSFAGARKIPQTINVENVASRKLDLFRLETLNVNPQDVVDRKTQKFESIIDSLGVTNTPSRQNSLKKSILASVGTSSTVKTASELFRNRNLTLNYAPQLPRQIVSWRDLSLNTNYSSTNTRSIDQLRSVAESLSSMDVQGVEIDIFRTFNSGFNLNPGLVVDRDLARIETTTFDLTGSFFRTSTSSRLTSFTLDFSSSATRLSDLRKIQEDVISFSDAHITDRIFSRNFAQNYVHIQSTSRSIEVARFVSSGFNVAGTANLGLGLLRSFDLAYSYNVDGTDREVGQFRAFTTSTSFNTGQEILRDNSRIISAGFSYISAAHRSQNQFRAITQALGLQETTARTLLSERLEVTGFKLTDGSSRLTETLRATTENLNIGATALRSQNAARTLISNIHLTSQTTTLLDADRVISSNINAGQSIEISSELLRSFSSSLSVLDSSETRVSNSRLITDTLEHSSNLNRATDILRGFSTAYAFNNDLGRQIQLDRIKSETVSFESSYPVLLDYTRLLESGFVYSSGFERTGSVVRLTLQEISLGNSQTREISVSRVEKLVSDIAFDRSRASNILRLDTESLSIAGEQISYQRLGRDTLANIAASTNIFRSVDAGRKLSTSINLQTQESRLNLISRSLSDSLIYGSATSSTTSLFRHFSQPTSFNSISTSETEVFRVLNSIYNPQSDLKRDIILERRLDQTINLGSVNKALRQYNKEIGQGLSYISGTQSANTLFRAFAENLVLQNFEDRSISVNRVDNTFVNLESERIRLIESIRSISQVFTFGDSTSALQNIARDTPTGLSITETTGRFSVNLREFSEIFSAFDDASRDVEASRALDSSLSYSETAKGSVNLIRTFSDSIDYSTGVGQASSTIRLVEGIYTLSEGGFRTDSVLVRGINQATNFEGNFLSYRNYEKAITETINQVSTLQQSSNVFRQFEQSISIAHSPFRQLVIDRIETDSLSITDGNIRHIEDFRRLSSNINFENRVSSTQNIQRAVLVSLTASNDAERITDTLRVLSQGYVATDSNLRNSDLFRTLSDSLSLQESVNSNLNIGRTITGQFFSTSSTSSDFVGFRDIQSSFNLNETQDRYTELWKLVDTNLNAGTTTGRLTYGFRATAEGLSVGGPVISSSSTYRLAVVAFDISDEINREGQLGRKISSALGYISDSSAESLLFRVESTDLNLQSRQVRLSEIFTEIEQSFNFEAGTKSTLKLEKIVTDSISLQTQTESYLDIFKTINQNFGINEDGSRYRFWPERSTATGLSFEDSPLRNSNVIRSVLDSINLDSGQTGSRLFKKSFSETFTASTSVSEVQDFVRILETGVGYDSENIVQKILSRVISPGFGFEDIVDDGSSDEEDSTSSDGSSGGGGGSSGSETESSSGGGGGLSGGLFGSESPDLSFAGEKITVKLATGEGSTAQVELENNGKAKADAKLELERLNAKTVNAITLSNSSYIVEPGSSVNPVMTVKAPEYLDNQNLSDRVLERSLKASASGSEASIPINILIRSKDDELLDVKIDLEDNKVSEKEGVDYNFEVFNLGQSERVDIQMFTTVRNSTGHIVHEEKEEIAVETSASVARDLDVELEPGRYKVEVRAKYANKNASSFSTLRIEEKKGILSGLGLDTNLALLILATLANLTLLAVLVYRRRKTDYDELIQQSIRDIKDYSKDNNIDFKKLLEKEESHKDRKTLEKWAARKAGEDPSKYEDEESIKEERSKSEEDNEETVEKQEEHETKTEDDDKENGSEEEQEQEDEETDADKAEEESESEENYEEEDPLLKEKVQEKIDKIEDINSKFEDAVDE